MRCASIFALTALMTSGGFSADVTCYTTKTCVIPDADAAGVLEDGIELPRMGMVVGARWRCVAKREAIDKTAATGVKKGDENCGDKEWYDSHELNGNRWKKFDSCGPVGGGENCREPRI